MYNFNFRDKRDVFESDFGTVKPQVSSKTVFTPVILNNSLLDVHLKTEGFYQTPDGIKRNEIPAVEFKIKPHTILAMNTLLWIFFFLISPPSHYKIIKRSVLYLKMETSSH